MAKKKEQTSRLGLTEIYLGGFQVFEQLTRIPLSRLTFLFGPNSAGKSAVEDALLLLQEETSPEDTFDQKAETLTPRLVRHWRRTHESVDSLADSMIVGIKAKLPNTVGDALLCNLHDEEQPSQRFGKYQPGGLTSTISRADQICIDYRLSFGLRRPKQNYQMISASRKIELFINGEIAIWLDPKRFGINFSNAYLKGLDSEIIHTIGFDLIKKSSCVSFEDRRLEVKGDIELTAARLIDQDRVRYGWFQEAENLASIESWTDDEETGNLSRDAANLAFAVATEATGFLPLAAAIFDRTHHAVLSQLGPLLNAIVVPASRTIPSEQDLTFYFDEATRKPGEIRLQGRDFPIHWNSITTSTSSPYRQLALSHHDHLSKTNDTYRWTLAKREFKNTVERTLSKVLFADRSYTIGYDFRVLLSPDEFDALANSRRLDDGVSPSDYAHAIRLFLVDSSKREFSFSEVGSGLGYVLPVILAAFDPVRSTAIVQQPELHLHPALQSCLGDIFVEAVGGAPLGDSCSLEPWARRQLIIETHSEHILLRVLRRIRQTQAGRVERHLKIVEDDVAVVYFDPQPDGTTKVVHLPISSEGEFLARWPRGFFTEREVDLFEDDDA